MTQSTKITIGMLASPDGCPNLRAAAETAPAYGLQELTQLKDALAFIGSVKAGLLIVEITERQHLLWLGAMVKQLKIAQGKHIKILVINSQLQFEKVISKLGLHDYLKPKATVKALRFKLDFMERSVLAQDKKSEAKELQTKQVTEAIRGRAAEEKKAQGIQWVAPLEHPDDIWILRTEGDCVNRLSKFVVRMIAPSPFVGRWIAVDQRDTWVFKFKDDINPFMPVPGQWFYYGSQKPEFIWEENTWLFVGSVCELYLDTPAGRQYRFQGKDGVFQAARNSEAALAKRELINKSFQNDMKYTSEKIAGEKAEVDGQGGVGELLSGVAETEHLDQSPLSGAQDGTDKLSAPLLSHDADPQLGVGFELASAASRDPHALDASAHHAGKMLAAPTGPKGKNDTLEGKGAQADYISSHYGREGSGVTEKERAVSPRRAVAEETPPGAGPLLAPVTPLSEGAAQGLVEIAAVGGEVAGVGAAADRITTHYGRGPRGEAASPASANSWDGALPTGATRTALPEVEAAASADAPEGRGPAVAGEQRGPRERALPRADGEARRKGGEDAPGDVGAVRDGEDAAGQSRKGSPPTLDGVQPPEDASPRNVVQAALRQSERDGSPGRRDHAKTEQEKDDGVVSLSERRKAQAELDMFRMVYDKAAKQHRRS